MSRIQFLTIAIVMCCMSAAYAYDPMPDPRMSPRDEVTGTAKYAPIERSARARWYDQQSKQIRGDDPRDGGKAAVKSSTRDSRAWR